jgi:phytoene dehydrogenase-like protein
MILVVGAGLAGLTCARLLAEAGQRVLVLEAASAVGGRVRTDVTADGYRLDRGFQVLFAAYPAVRRLLDMDALKPRRFDPGAILVKDARRYEIADPLREPSRLVTGLLNPLIPFADKLRVLDLNRRVTRLSSSAIFRGVGQPHGQDESIFTYLRRLGFTEKGFIDAFARPFYGGILLDRSLSASARIFQFTFKMLASGETLIPAEGMQRIPEQLAAALPAGSLRLRAPVRELLTADRKVRGVLLADGETLEAEQVVLAIDGPGAARLSGIELPDEPVGSVCLYFAGDEQLYGQRKILLNTRNDAFVNNAVLLTNIAPTYAPPHKHLLSVSVLDDRGVDDEELARRSLCEMASWFPGRNLQDWHLLAVYRIPFSQFAQPPGVFDALPGSVTAIEGLFLAGEYTQSSSIQGAMHSGEHAAQAILKQSAYLPTRRPGKD